MVRFRRTKLGLSQAKLGELVGRSPSTVRSWERDRSMPTEPAVLHALSAVLGVDERALFEKAGQEPPLDQETSPTLEEALASLTITEEAGEGDDEQRGEAVSVEQRTDEVDLTGEQTASDQTGRHAEEPETDPPEPLPPRRDPGYVKPPEPYVVMPTTPRFVEPSYVEDAHQRQIYRVRNLATLVVAVALLVALIWALSESLGALGSWWDEFFGSLRL